MERSANTIKWDRLVAVPNLKGDDDNFGMRPHGATAYQREACLQYE